MKKLHIPSLIVGCALMGATLYAQADSKFVKDASEGGMAEVKLGQLAQEKATSQAVKDFGFRMVVDHSKAGDELKGIAAQEGMTPSSSMSVGYDALRAKLALLSGSAFDKAYMSAMVKDHQEDVAAFQKEADNGSDPKLKHFAAKTLPTLEDHLRMAQKTASVVGASY